MRSSWPVLLVLLGACDNGSSAASHQKVEQGSGRKLAGVYPDQFKCSSILTDAEVGGMLGGTAHLLDSAVGLPRGIASPCAYQVVSDGNAEYWTFDFDCRDGMKQRADKLFEQYKSGSSDMVDRYNALADAGGIKPTDAGIVIHAPEPAVEVDVGAKGLDHHGQGLFFIDDDAPCSVRVVGPDAQRRLQLAKAIAKNLTFANAPMTPRPMP